MGLLTALLFLTLENNDLGHFSTPLMISAIVLGFFFVWRVWRFTVEPMMKPGEPRELPYWIPFIGHLKTFFQDDEALQQYGRSHFRNSREIFALTVAGQKIYVVTAPDDISAVFKNHPTITFDGYIKDMYRAFGMSGEGIAKMFEPLPSTRSKSEKKGAANPTSGGQKYAHLGLGIHREQLYAGQHLEQLIKIFLTHIEAQQDWTRIPKNAVLRSEPGEKAVSLRGWCQSVLGRATAEAFFGKRLLEVEPKLLEYFHVFDSSSWMLLYQYPRLFAGEMYSAMDKGTQAFTKYFQLPQDERRDACHYIQSVETKQLKYGMDVRDIAIAGHNLFWLSNTNSAKFTFWLLLYVIDNPSVLHSLREELAPAVSGIQINVKLLENCPLMDAVFNETLRLTSGITSARNVDATTIVAGKTLVAGAKIIIPYRQLHYDETVFGPAVRTFNPARFLDNKDLRNSPSFKPFGGGTTYCSGRFLAKRQIVALVAVILKHYDMELEDKEKGIPLPDLTKRTFGVIDPVGNGDIVVRIKARLT